MENLNKGKNLKVVVVTYNRVEFTKRTLDSLLKTVPEARIYIYDNASTEEGMKELLDSYLSKGNVNIHDSDQNFGWGKAVNEVFDNITVYDDDFVLLSNNDVEYSDDWYEKALALYEKYPNIGILGLWKHPNHGVKEDLGDLIVKDQMPATCWLLKPKVILDLGSIAEHGPCATKGGNGEDVDYCIKAEQKGYLVAGPKEDLAIHIGE